MSEARVLGRPIWHELVTTDMDAAAKFYGPVVGWTAEPMAGGPIPYQRFTRRGGQAAGGVMTIPSGMNVPPHWAMYIGTPELEKTIAHVETLGGKTMSPPIEVPGFGRGRVMLDPQGAMFALWQPAMDGEPPQKPAVAEASWHELYTGDAAGAVTFYGEVFGWTEMESHDMGPMGTYHVVGLKHPHGGIMNKTAEMAQLPSFWNVYFRVEEINAAVARVKEHGGTVIMGPIEVPGGDWVVQALDPQGAMFALHEMRS